MGSRFIAASIALTYLTARSHDGKLWKEDNRTESRTDSYSRWAALRPAAGAAVEPRRGLEAVVEENGPIEVGLPSATEGCPYLALDWYCLRSRAVYCSTSVSDSTRKTLSRRVFAAFQGMRRRAFSR